ncbi:MAG: competence protein ComEA [Chloroflexi bacterium]|nr:MAG: competence protein ComEA [Chloroflexota bacterium]
MASLPQSGGSWAESAHPTATKNSGRKLGGVLNYLLGSLTTLALVGGGQFLLRKPDPPPLVVHAPPTAAPTATAEPTPPPPPTATPPPITIFVSGAVQQPGLYQLPAEARLGDAILVAGGLTEEAAAGQVNQAEKLWDGAHIRIPTLGEAATAPQSSSSLAGSGATSSSGSTLSSGGRINLNTASLDQLDSLPGIGPAKAQAIIDHRPFAAVDDITRVPGIGPSTLNQLRDLITVQ